MLQLRSGVNVALARPRFPTQLSVGKDLHGHFGLPVLGTIDCRKATLPHLVYEGEVLEAHVWTAGDELLLLLWRYNERGRGEE